VTPAIPATAVHAGRRFLSRALFGFSICGAALEISSLWGLDS
jgi:hypothetical protein